MTMEELNVIINAQTKPFRDELAKMQMQMKSATTTVERQTGRIKTALGSVAKFVAGLAIARSLFNIGKSAINMASSLQEVQNVVDVAFGSMAWKAERFAKSSLASFGMSELSAKKTSSTYMSMAKSARINDDAASDMAITLAGLTGDVASFFNISQELADVRLKSVFTGETETLKELGVVMTQTNLEAFALSQGITKNIQDMNQAEQTTLRYNFVLERLAFTQGDFAKTSGSWANQVRILQEQWKQLLGIIGNGLVAVLTPVIKVINIVIGKLITFANVISAVFSKLFGKRNDTNKTVFDGVSSSVDSGADSLGGYSDALDQTGAQAKKTAKEIEGSLAGFDELNVIKTGADSGDSGGTGAGATGGGYDIDPIDWGNSFPEPDTSGIDVAVEKVMGYVNKLKSFLATNGPIITSILAGLLAGFTAFNVLSKWGSIISLITGPISTLKTWIGLLGLAFAEATGPVSFLSALFGTALGPIIAISVGIGAVVGALVYLWQTSDVFRANVTEALQNICDVLVAAYEVFIKPIFDGLLVALQIIMEVGIKPLLNAWVNLVEVLSNATLELWNFIAPHFTKMLQWLGPILSGACEALGMVVGIVVSVIIGVLTTLITVVTTVVDFIVKAIKWLIENWNSLQENTVKVITIIIQTFTNMGAEINKCIKALVDFVISYWANMIKSVVTALIRMKDSALQTLSAITNNFHQWFSGLKQIFYGVVDFVTGVFTGDWGRAWEGVVSIFKGIFNTIAGVVKAPINAVIGIINGAISGINGFGFDVPDWVPFGLGGKSFRIDVPNIPYLATGGIVSRSTLAMIGEAGQEAVIPLRRNTQGIEMIANRLLENMPIGEGNGATYLIQLVLEDGTVIAKKMIKNIKDYEIMTGKPAF